MTALADYIVDYISESILSSTRTGKAGIDTELKKYGLDPAKATLNADGTIDYNDDVNMRNRQLAKIPFKFKKVNGHFDISFNNLTSLKGCPEEVNGNFYCAFNELTSLEGGPERVSYDYECENNILVSLKGAPKEIKGSFACSMNDLTNLEHCPQVISGSFMCFQNYLTSLEGGPKRVSGKEYYCSHNQLTSLEGIPSKLNGYFYCDDNPGDFTKDDVLNVCKISRQNIAV